jgi:ribosome-binding factor A
MRTYPRSQRVAGELQRQLAELLHRSVKDPRVSQVTITGVRLSADLKQARVYFVSPGGRPGRERAAAGLGSAVGFLKRELAHTIGLRSMPEIRFVYDESLDYGERIDRLLKTLESDHEADHPATE